MSGARAQQRWERRRRQRRVLTAVLAAAVLLAVLVTVYFALRDSPAPRATAAPRLVAHSTPG